MDSKTLINIAQLPPRGPLKIKVEISKMPIFPRLCYQNYQIVIHIATAI